MPQNGAIRSLNYLFCLETLFVVKPEKTALAAPAFMRSISRAVETRHFCQAEELQPPKSDAKLLQILQNYDNLREKIVN